MPPNARLRFLAIVAASLAALAVVGIALARTILDGPNASAPSPTAVAAPLVGLPPPDAATAHISVPSGFAIRIFAQNIPGTPRFMAFGPDGQLYISLLGSGQIARLPDLNGDGLADGVQIVASGLNAPHGLEWRDGSLYVASTSGVFRLSSSSGNGQLDVSQLVTNNIPGMGQHFTRTLHFGPDGKLYVSAGSDCNFCVETDPRRAAILRFNADGTIPADNPFATDPDTRKQAVWASGLRNAVDFLFTPGGQLWADHNGSDGLGDALPPEEIVLAITGGHTYGWPYCYTPGLGPNLPPSQRAEVADTRLPLPAGFDCSQATPAIFTDLAHSAPLGMSLATNSSFPTAMRSDLFVAYHGSWNTSAPANYRDCKVERIVVQNGQPVQSETFANGWRSGGLCGDPSTWGRPADVAFGPDGAMYISDDAAGRVYRVVYVGPSGTPAAFLPAVKNGG